MNRIAVLLIPLALLSGCQSMKSEPASTNRSIYNGNNSLLYEVKNQSASTAQAMQIAAGAYQAGELDQALYQYLRAIEMDPERYEALVWVGRIHRERGNERLAQMAFSDVLSSAPDNPDALAEMGLLALAMHQQGEATQMLSKAVMLDQQRQGGAAAMADAANLKVDAQSPLKVYNGLGVLADLRNDFSSAEAYYRLALKIEPRSAQVQNSIGYSNYLAGNWEQAESAYRLGIVYDSKYKSLWRNYGLLLARKGQYEQALSAFEQVESRAEASNDVGYICLIEGQLEGAEQFLRSAIELSPSYYTTAWDNLNRVQQIKRIRQPGLTQVEAAPTPVVTAVAVAAPAVR
jgi:tetratricopeptide (TPR) repeat protein